MRPMQKDPSRASKLVPYSNLVLFLILHIVLVMGLRAVFGPFVSTVGGVSVAVGAYLLWRQQPKLWQQGILGPTFGILAVVLFKVFEHYAVPPPPPPPFEISQQADGSWHFNRGGGVLTHVTYLVLPPADAPPPLPRAVGSVKVVSSLDPERSVVEWQTLRAPFKGASRYRVRPLREKEGPPQDKDMATLTEELSPGRVRLDVGERQKVSKNELYSIVGMGNDMNPAYVVVDRLSPDAAEGFVVDAGALNPPYHLERVRAGLNQVLTELRGKASLAEATGNRENALVYYKRLLALSGGTHAQAEARLRELEAQNGQK